MCVCVCVCVYVCEYLYEFPDFLFSKNLLDAAFLFSFLISIVFIRLDFSQ